MKLKLLLGASAFSLLATQASATSFLATTDSIVGGVSATAEAVSDATSSLADSKIVLAARDDAASFVASGGDIRGANLEAALGYVRTHAPALAHENDLSLAEAILSN